MKQGRPSHSGSASNKVEPSTKLISPGAVSRLGEHVAVTTKHEPMVMGKGAQAPVTGCTIHNRGSQGKH